MFFKQGLHSIAQRGGCAAFKIEDSLAFLRIPALNGCGKNFALAFLRG